VPLCQKDDFALLGVNNLYFSTQRSFSWFRNPQILFEGSKATLAFELFWGPVYRALNQIRVWA